MTNSIDMLEANHLSSFLSIFAFLQMDAGIANQWNSPEPAR